MSLEFIGRLQKELSFTGSVVYESVLAIAERVNRKVQILRLHGQASSLLSDLEAVHQELGRRIALATPDKTFPVHQASGAAIDLDRPLTEAVDRVHQLKQTLLLVDSQIRELKMETIHEDLLKLQRDLSLRSAALERFLVAPGSPAAGKSVTDLDVPPSVRFVTIFRGPFLIPPSEGFLFRPDDIAIAIGLRADLDQVAVWFTQTRKTKST